MNTGNPIDPRFRVSQKTVIGYFLYRHCLWIMIPCVAIVAGLAVWSAISSDLRFAILALMALFIVAPMIIMFEYFFYALHPDIAFNTLPHTISIAEAAGQIRITVYPEAKEKNIKTKEESVTYFQGEQDEIPEPAPFEKIVCIDQLKKPVIGINNTIIGFGDRGLLFVPEKILNANPQLMSLIKNQLFSSI